MKKNEGTSEDLQSWRIWKTEEFQKLRNLKMKIFNFGGGVTHRIRMMISEPRTIVVGFWESNSSLISSHLEC